MKKIVDMDGNELNVGDIVLFATGNKNVARAKITDISDYGWLKLHTLKNRFSTARAMSVLLDKKPEESKNEVKITCPYCNSEEVEYVDDICTEIDTEGGSGHYRYSCHNEECYEDFYVFMAVDTTMVQVSKKKYEDYKTIFEKGTNNG